MERRGRLFVKYVIFFAGLVCAALLASSLIELYFTYQENKAALVAVQREKAQAAAGRIEQFIREIERQMGWTTQPVLAAGIAGLEQRRVDFLRLQRQVPPITELSYLDAEGREQLRVSRLAMDVLGSQADFSGEPRFVQARATRVYYGPVYFRKESEPYMTLALAGSGQEAGVTVAEVNLKFIWDVISQIKAGAARIGAGRLGDRIEVHTGDELEALAEQFNSMGSRLQESYANLEQKVEDRTRELTESLE